MEEANTAMLQQIMEMEHANVRLQSIFAQKEKHVIVALASAEPPVALVLGYQLDLSVMELQRFASVQKVKQRVLMDIPVLQRIELTGCANVEQGLNASHHRVPATLWFVKMESAVNLLLLF